MVRFARFLMRLGLLLLLAAFLVWIVSLPGFLGETARCVPHAAGGGLLLLVIGSSIFFRRTSGVRLPPNQAHEQHK